MISRKTLIALGVAALAAVAAAAWLARERVEPAPAALFPGLAGRIADLSQVRMKSPKGEVTLVKSDDRWLVREKGDYPASAARLRELIQGLAGLSAPEAKTRDPKRYERVGLDPERGERPARLELLDAAGQPVASLWIGRARALVTDMQRNEYFVRRGDEPQVWRVEGRLPEDPAPEQWIEKRILTLERGRIRAVAVAPRGGPAYRVARPGAEVPEFALDGLGAGEQPGSPLRVNGLVSAVQNLGADDVLRSDAAQGLEERGRVAVETFDGLTVELRLLAANGKRCAGLSAAGAGTEAVAQEAERLNRQWRGWTFQLADYQADSLFAPRSELVQAAAPVRKGSEAPGAKPAAPNARR